MADEAQRGGAEQSQRDETPGLIAQIEAATDRPARKALLKEIGNRPSQAVAEALLPWLHDKSPRVTGRILAIFAFHQMDEAVESNLSQVDKKRADHLQGRYRRFRQGDDRDDSAS